MTPEEIRNQALDEALDFVGNVEINNDAEAAAIGKAQEAILRLKSPAPTPPERREKGSCPQCHAYPVVGGCGAHPCPQSPETAAPSQPSTPQFGASSLTPEYNAAQEEKNQRARQMLDASQPSTEQPSLADNLEWMDLLNKFGADPSIDNAVKLTEFAERHTAPASNAGDAVQPEKGDPCDDCKGNGGFVSWDGGQRGEYLCQSCDGTGYARTPTASSADMQEANACAYRRDDGTNCECGWPSTRCREYVRASTPTANGAA